MNPKTPDQRDRHGRTNTGSGDSLDDEDFLDDGIEDDFDDASWADEGGDSSGEESFEEPVKKNKSRIFSFNTIVIVLAVIFGGGFVLTQMAKRGASIQSAEVVAPVSRLQMSGMRDNPVFKDVRKEPERLPVGPSGEPVTAEIPQPSAPLPEESAIAAPGKVSDKTNGVSSGSPEQISDIPRAPAADVLTPLPSPQSASPAPEQEVSGGADPLAPFRKKGKKEDEASYLHSAEDLSSTGAPKDISLSKVSAVPAVPVPEVVKTGLQPETSIKDLSATSTVMSVDLENKVGEGESAPLTTGVWVNDSFQKSTIRPLANKDMEEIRKTISSLEARLSGIETRLADVSRKADLLRSPHSQNTEIEALKDSVGQLQKELAGSVLRDGMRDSAQEQLLQSSSKRPVAEKIVKTEVPVKRAPSESGSVSHKPRKEFARKETVQTSPPSKRWEIRAIQPGVAWVAPQGGEDVQTVEVGDVLAGLGTIKSISVVNGVWVVEGTKGRLQQ